jgi:hypothetical protein
MEKYILHEEKNCFYCLCFALFLLYFYVLGYSNLHAAVSLSENTATGTSIYRIEATDSDGDTLSYTQISGTSEFELIGQDVKTILSPDYTLNNFNNYKIIWVDFCDCICL